MDELQNRHASRSRDRSIGRRPSRVLTGLLVMALAPASLAVAQQKGHVPAATAAAIYDGAGRRDPFVSLAMMGSDPRSEGRGRYQGLAGVLVSEAVVKGIVLSQGVLVALVQAPDKRTYIVRPNDRLLDGSIRAVTPEAVVFVQQVNDPLSLVKQREIRKPLRVEESK